MHAPGKGRRGARQRIWILLGGTIVVYAVGVASPQAREIDAVRRGIEESLHASAALHGRALERRALVDAIEELETTGAVLGGMRPPGEALLEVVERLAAADPELHVVDAVAAEGELQVVLRTPFARLTQVVEQLGAAEMPLRLAGLSVRRDADVSGCVVASLTLAPLDGPADSPEGAPSPMLVARRGQR